MTDYKKLSAFNLIVLAIVILIAAAGGVYLGSSAKLMVDTADEQVFSDDTFTQLKLKPGTALPEIPLTGSNQITYLCSELLDDKGMIFLFLDANCPPCHDLSVKIQKLIDDDQLLPEQVIGISFGKLSGLDEMIAQNQLTFSFYHDQDLKFLYDYGVDAFPLLVALDKEKQISSIVIDSRVELSLDSLTIWFE